MRPFCRIVACSIFVLTTSVVFAADEPAEATKKPGPKETHLWSRGPAIDVLKKDLELSDDQVEKIKTNVDAVKKAFDAKEEVIAAEEALKKADAAHKAAAEKVKFLKESDHYLDDLKKAVYDAVPAEKKDKAAVLIHMKGAPKESVKAAEKAKADDKPKDEAKPAGDMGN